MIFYKPQINLEDVDEEKQDASYFNFGGFSHDDMHPTLDRNGSGSVPNTKSIKVRFHNILIEIVLTSFNGDFRIIRRTRENELCPRQVNPTPSCSGSTRRRHGY